jgi:ERCC4-type nuclease
MITFKIDAREHKLKDILMQSIDCEECLAFLGVECDNLFCGDFVIEVDGKPIVAIERKTLADLVASVKDGRYRVQKTKLLEYFNGVPIVYLVEGRYDFNPSIPLMIEGMEKYSVLSSIINTQLRDRIQVVNTKDLEDTFDFLHALLVRICKDPKKYASMTQNTIGVVKKEDLISSKPKVGNKQDMFFYQLTQVPGISAKTAQAFVDKYDNMKAFYEAFKGFSDEENLKTLKNITIEDNTKKRRINGKVAENIVRFML